MPNRSADWLLQAKRDLDQAEDSRLAGRHEWACFAAHQSAEKATKALHLNSGQEAWGHVVARLLIELPEDIDVSEELVEKAKVLDNFYIPTRYPNRLYECTCTNALIEIDYWRVFSFRLSFSNGFQSQHVLNPALEHILQFRSGHLVGSLQRRVVSIG